jgi:phosphatidylserine/phosphatidylglycerophosphate/cardiolipin synthase-like enzyme
VTDNKVFIGTNNWSADYFERTAGVSLNIHTHINATLSQQVQSTFMEDWNSPRATPIESFVVPQS